MRTGGVRWADGLVHVELPFRTPFDAAVLRRVLTAHAIPGAERIDARGHHRTYVAAGGPAVVTLHWDEVAEASFPVTIRPTTPTDIPEVISAVRRWLDLDADPDPVVAHLADDPLLASVVAAHPGIRVPGAPDGVELGFQTVLGQQVSLAAANTVGGRLVRHFGTPIAEGLFTYPDASTVADCDVAELRAVVGLNGARARTLVTLARAVVDGLDLGPDADRPATRAALLALPGIGRWSADYIELRALGNRDIFMSTDLVARKALDGMKERDADALAARWAPWRGYALMYLWAATYYAVPAAGATATTRPARGEP